MTTPKLPTVAEIVEAYLKEHDFDGLCTQDCDGCKMGDLLPCVHGGAKCVPGYHVDCKKCPERETCDTYQEWGESVLICTEKAARITQQEDKK
jgi:hypothetical protein